MDWYRLSSTPMAQKLSSLRPALAEAAQKVYDQWEQDGAGQDAMLGPGGICQDIADALADVIMDNGMNAHVMDNEGMGEQHVWVVAYSGNEAFHVDIPSGAYETGGGYTWSKIPDVQFDGTDISIQRADRTTLDYVRGEV